MNKTVDEILETNIKTIKQLSERLSQHKKKYDSFMGQISNEPKIKYCVDVFSKMIKSCINRGDMSKIQDISSDIVVVTMAVKDDVTTKGEGISNKNYEEVKTKLEKEGYKNVDEGIDRICRNGKVNDLYLCVKTLLDADQY